MKQMILPDYNNSIVNLMSSIRKYFDLDYEGYSRYFIKEE